MHASLQAHCMNIVVASEVVTDVRHFNLYLWLYCNRVSELVLTFDTNLILNIDVIQMRAGMAGAEALARVYGTRYTVGAASSILCELFVFSGSFNIV